MKYLLAGIRNLAVGIVVAMLPSPERERLAREYYLDAPRWSVEVGLLQGFSGVTLFLLGGLAFMRPAATGQSMILIDNWFPGLSTTHFQGLGLINWLAWFLFPLSWPFAYLALVGLMRCVAFAVTREAVAEPIVWGALRFVQATRTRSAAACRDRKLGPPRPDRVEPGEGTDLVVYACREKEGWIPAATIAVGERYYRITSVEERPDGAWHAVVYRLREQHAGAIIRRFVEYSPPGGFMPATGRR
ncbi:MAG: hypothetical protein R3344_01565 [Acidobacteriota bacterium]|nr:hypothetical protein [Acidobacteriota bacterium]